MYRAIVLLFSLQEFTTHFILKHSVLVAMVWFLVAATLVWFCCEERGFLWSGIPQDETTKLEKLVSHVG